MTSSGGKGECNELGDGDFHAHITMYKQRANESLLYSTGNSTRCSVITYMGRKSKKEEVYVYIWLTHSTVQQKITRHGKAAVLCNLFKRRHL